jgi:hypothetical protein
MRASQVLQKCLGRSLQPMHEARSRACMNFVGIPQGQSEMARV